MFPRTLDRPIVCLLATVALGSLASSAGAVGARQHRSSPVQVTTDGRSVYVARELADDVVRYDAWTDEVEVVAGGDGCVPASVSITSDAESLWIACSGTDGVDVRSPSGELLARIALPFGASPNGVALSPDDALAVVTLRRGNGIALLDAVEQRVIEIVPTRQPPLGACWSADGERVWVTHALTDGASTRVTELAIEDGRAVVRAIHPVGEQQPVVSVPIAHPWLAEGGFVVFGGAAALRPGTDEVWLPARHLNANDNIASDLTTVQAAVHRLRRDALRIDASERLAFTARNAHDPSSPTDVLGDGWAAAVAGPVDVAFDLHGATAYVVNENSDDVLVVPAELTPYRPDRAPPLVEIPVGSRPRGIALSPVGEVAFVYNELSHSLSIVDLVGQQEWRQVALPHSGRSSEWIRGARLFFTSADERASREHLVACGSCHVDGEGDGLVWAFDVGNETGPRQTQTIRGLGLTEDRRDPRTGRGPYHRAGDMDSLTRFICAFSLSRQNGTGFLTSPHPPSRYEDVSQSPQCAVGGGPARDLETFLSGLAPLARSPARRADLSLSPAAERGAVLFRSPLGAEPACATCHDPEQAFTDGGYHDVGAWRSPDERQLDRLGWAANTPTLVGLFATAPYDDGGRSGEALPTVVDLLSHLATHEGHGGVRHLAPAQRADLAEFLLSIDDLTTAQSVTDARDDDPPRIVRVEPVSSHRIEVWLDETVTAASAELTTNWTVLDELGEPLEILAAQRHERGDRVSLRVDLPRECAPATFTVSASGVQDASPDGLNALDPSDPANTRSFVLGDELTITLGQSPDAHVTVPVHDAGLGIGHGEDRPVLRAGDGEEGASRGLVRFEWGRELERATGVVEPERILEAAVSLRIAEGVPQPVRARRVLQFWSEPTEFGDPSTASDPGAPDQLRASGGVEWSAPGASALGGDGAPADYRRSFDLTETVDAVATPESVEDAVVLSGPAITDAHRLWLGRPDLSLGHALELEEGSSSELRLHSAEERDGALSPMLTITYALPPAAAAVLPEVSAPGSGVPLRVASEAGALTLSFEDVGSAYDVTEGALSDFTTPVGGACDLAARVLGRRAEVQHEPASGSRWFLVSASGPCGGALGGVRGSGRCR